MGFSEFAETDSDRVGILCGGTSLLNDELLIYINETYRHYSG